MKRRQPEAGGDPWPYDGPLRRVDGTAPYNHFLWPLAADWYWAHKDLGHAFTSRWNFSAVALADGRWLSDGFVRSNENEMQFFSTREAALRHSAAEMVRMARSARKSETKWHWGLDYLSPEKFVELVNWTRDKLELPHLNLKVRPEPSLRPHWADLPLFAET